MVDKKTPNKKVNKESKEQRFKRIATPRVKKVLKSLDILENCSNTSVYSYSQKEVNQMFTTIENKINVVKQSYSNTKESLEFDFE